MYNWYTPDYQTLLGTDDWLTLRPLPPIGTQYVLEIIPFPGLGCRDTLTTTIKFPTEPIDLKVKDTLAACEDKGADITASTVVAGSSSNLMFTYFMDPLASTFIQEPKKILKSGTYYIKARNFEGCTQVKPVIVDINKLPKLTVHDPPSIYLPATVDLTAPSVTSGSDPNLTFSYWRDGTGSSILSNAGHIEKSGDYYIRAVNQDGCATLKGVKVTVLPPLPPELRIPNAFSPNNASM